MTGQFRYGHTNGETLQKGKSTMSLDKQTAEFIGTMAQNLPPMSADIMQGWIENPKALQKFLANLNPPANGSVAEPVSEFVSVANLDWRKTYEALGMSDKYGTEVSKLEISEQPGLWTIPVIKGATCNWVVAALKKLGVKVWQYADDLDKSVTENDRDPSRDGSYAVSFKATVEADEENADQSANQRRKKGCKDITLLERLLLELAHFLATKRHLDIDNVTLCSGSRYSDGGVPRVRFHSGTREVRVYWCNPGRSFGRLRARAAVPQKNS